MSTLAADRIRPRSIGVAGGAGFWLVAYAFAVTMAFSAVPTPLYPLYEARDGFGPFIVTVVFATYAVGVMASLFLVGHLSDRYGRRRALLPALALEAVAAVCFVAWPELPGLLVARLLSGVGVGLVSATATAHLAELHAMARPGAGAQRGNVVATAANMGGIGLGPLVAGALAQWLAGPLVIPYVAFLVALLVAALGIGLAPETVERSPGRRRYRPQRISVPEAARPRYAAAAAAMLTAFAVFALFTSLVPSVLAVTLQRPSHALAGAAAFVVCGSAAGAQLLLARMSAHRQLVAGLGLMGLGLPLVTAAVWAASLPLLLLAAAIAGAGAGVLVRACIATATELADPPRRGEALAGLFLAGYAGLALPVLGLGAATQLVSQPVAVLGFAATVLALLAAVSRLLLQRDRVVAR